MSSIENFSYNMAQEMRTTSNLRKLDNIRRIAI